MLKCAVLTTLNPAHDGLIKSYARTSGSDFSVGSLENPFATLEGCSRRVETALYGRRRHTIDISGLTDSREVLEGFITPRTAGRVTFDPAPTEHPSFLIDAPFMVRAVPTTVLTIPTFNTTVEDTHDMLTVTVPGASWTTDEWAGFMLGGSGYAESCMISRNTNDTLYIACGVPMTGPLEIWDYSATLDFGVTGDFNAGLELHTYGSALFQGIRFSTKSTGFAVTLECRGGGTTYLSNCRFDGGLQVKGSGTVVLDNCYITGRFGFDNNVEVTMGRSAMYQAAAASHAGDFSFSSVRVRECGPLGHGGSGTVMGTFDLRNCEILDGTGNGVDYNGGKRASVRNTVISGCNNDAVSATNPGLLFLSDVQGSGNGGYGIDAGYGVLVRTVGGTLVTGNLGDIRPGSLPVDVYANLPLFDSTGSNPQFVQFSKWA